MRALVLLLVVGCGGTKRTVVGEENCPIEMSVDPKEPTTSTPIIIAIAEEMGASYYWTVSGGTIKSGQATPTILVEGAPAGRLSATVALKGYGLGCPPSATVGVTVNP